MFTAKYFRTKFDEETRQAGLRARVEIHLQSGAVFEIESVKEVEEGFVVLQAYPPYDADAAAARRRPEPPVAGQDRGASDRIVVSYESISALHFAPADRHDARAVGF